MSSIIKGERIRNQSIINLSERFKAIHIEYEKAEIEDEAFERINHTTIGVAQNEVLATIVDNTETVATHLLQQNVPDEIIEEAQQMAAQILADAKQRAEEILSEALAKAQGIKEDTRAKQTQLLYETQEKMQSMLEEAHQEAKIIKRQAHEEKEELIRSSEKELTEVLQKLLGHIVSEELFDNTDWLACLVHKMLQECPTKEEIIVCVSPETYEKLSEEVKTNIIASGDKIKLEVKNNVSNTACIVETKQGNIVYDVMKGLERVISQIKILDKLS
ncbi:FliH/SctL family protein [Cellulosilyticum ruminicola]|uniref:FliH/SctL family protein n=1 Tax=Cellulosilyticum ruminicola TaxID=425254 RepID=UPI0006D0019B|nr:hypothetical protein [Cellulosilyticum ruminicola]